MEELFKEISNPREKKLLSDAQDLLKGLTEQSDKGRGIIDGYQRKNERLGSGVREYLYEYQRKNSTLKQNFEIFARAVEDGNVIKSMTSFEFEDLFDVPVEASSGNKHSSKLPGWFKEFKREEFEALRQNLEQLAKKLYKARVSEELLQERDSISNEIDELIADLRMEEQSSDWIVPKEKLVKIESCIVRLNEFDMIIPQIMAEVLNRASESARGLYNQFLEFRKNAQALQVAASQYQSETDRSLKSEFMNINFADSQKLRCKRYGLLLRNCELTTLQEGRTLNEKLLFFLTDYFHERCNYYKTLNSQQSINTFNGSLPYNEKYLHHSTTPGVTPTNTPMSSGVYVFKSSFFEGLVPPGVSLVPESANYDSVKMMTNEYRGFNNTIFDRFQRLLLSIQITTNNWILIEIKNYPEKEILVYDSDLRFFAGYHERVCSVLRSYIAQELRNKTELSTQEAEELASNYTGRTVASPQNNLPQDNAIYFAKNLHLCSQGNSVHPGSYRLDNINSFRLELFTFFIRIGINVDRPLPYEILL